jgi:hypothetical protein
VKVEVIDSELALMLSTSYWSPTLMQQLLLLALVDEHDVVLQLQLEVPKLMSQQTLAMEEHDLALQLQLDVEVMLQLQLSWVAKTTSLGLSVVRLAKAVSRQCEQHNPQLVAASAQGDEATLCSGR